MVVRLTIAGDIGSGKSTIAKRIAELVGVQPLSTGSIQRKLAQTRGLTVLGLNKLAEADPSIDKEIDQYLVSLPAGDLVVESRMAWHFVPETLKVYLYISDREAARRVAGAERSDENYGSIADSMEPILARRRSEIARFQKYYNVDIDDLRNYDIVVDTTFASVDTIARLLVYGDGGKTERPICWLDPRSLVPTQSIRELNDTRYREIDKATRGADFELANPVLALYVNHVFYILDGHVRTMAATKNRIQFVPTKIVASNNETYLQGLSALQYVKDAITDTMIYDWEDAAGFRYENEIWKGRLITT
jgi:cytidylate kinase